MTRWILGAIIERLQLDAGLMESWRNERIRACGGSCPQEALWLDGAMNRVKQAKELMMKVYGWQCDRDAKEEQWRREDREKARETEPVEPTDMDVTPVTMEYRCGACGHLVGYESAVPGEVGYKCQTCPECGREVKWNAAD